MGMAEQGHDNISREISDLADKETGYLALRSLSREDAVAYLRRYAAVCVRDAVQEAAVPGVDGEELANWRAMEALYRNVLDALDNGRYRTAARMLHEHVQAWYAEDAEDILSAERVGYLRGTREEHIEESNRLPMAIQALCRIIAR
jgi:hypothetical protein